MKVRELKKRLESLDPNLKIVIYTEDEELVRGGHKVNVFDVIGIDENNAELTRIDEAPSLKFGISDTSVKIATM